MNCACDYCLYNKGFTCILDGVNINSLGYCDDCVMVSINKETLTTEKERQLRDMEKRIPAADE